VPEELANWRKARATLAHDWLERRMLPILNTPASGSDDLDNRARLCLDAWTKEISPRVEALIGLLPGCLLPEALLKLWFDDRSIEQINVRALSKDAVQHNKVKDLAFEIQRLAGRAAEALQTFAALPAPERQRSAFESVLAFRTLLQELPRNSLLP
jgi:hypothetical protein